MDTMPKILEAIADGSCYFWFINFGDPGSLNDINVLDKSSIVGAIISGQLDLRTRPYTINGTIRDWMYFLVDGIYPPWAIFVKTIPLSARTNAEKLFFASRQEAVRKDIERSFGILIKKFQILAHPIRIRDETIIRNILYTCVILHNFTEAVAGHFIWSLAADTHEVAPSLMLLSSLSGVSKLLFISTNLFSPSCS